MQHDVRLRAAARVIYEGKYYPPDNPTFVLAENRRTAGYVDAVAAAIDMREAIGAFELRIRQLPLI